MFPNTQDAFYATHRSSETLAADKANIAELDQVAAASKERNTGCGAAVKGWVCEVAAKVRGKTIHVTLEKYLICGTMDSGQSNTVQFLLLPLAA